MTTAEKEERVEPGRHVPISPTTRAPRQSLREVQKQVTRERLIDAAVEEFRNRGDDGVAPAAGAGVPGGIQKFRGQARHSGHHGMMSLSIADPWLEFGADGVVLSVADLQRAPTTSPSQWREFRGPDSKRT